MDCKVWPSWNQLIVFKFSKEFNSDSNFCSVLAAGCSRFWLSWRCWTGFLSFNLTSSSSQRRSWIQNHPSVSSCRDQSDVEVKVCRHIGVSVNWTSDKRTLKLAGEATSLMISNFVAVLYDLWSRGKLGQTIKVKKKSLNPYSLRGVGGGYDLLSLINLCTKAHYKWCFKCFSLELKY